ncbi:MAG: ribF [Acidimicrobiaceae bacterium]|jgi:FAD synthase|nr:ribF [Acidimicrobiaceae bacterium]
MRAEQVTTTVVRGYVEHGDARGRELGFPTANLSISAGSPDGVWAGWLERADGSRHTAAISIGGRPTFYGDHGHRLLEAYVLDFAGDLYGELVTVTLGHFVRPQLRFDDVEALVAQLGVDVAACRTWCESSDREHARSSAARRAHPSVGGARSARRLG